MRGNTILVYATRDDWLPGLTLAENELGIRYVQSGIFDQAATTIYESAEAIPSFGYSKGDYVRDKEFLVLPPGISPSFRRIVRNSGQVRYACDHESTRNSIILRSGGLYEAEPAVIQGSIGKLTRSPDLDRFFRRIGALCTRQFLREGAYRVGPNAFQLYQTGYRLTPTIPGNPAYDLKISFDG
jgi:hypothetical protein